MQSTIYAEISQFKPKKLEKGKRVKESSLTSHVRAIKKDIAINNLQEGKVMYQHLSTHKNPTYEDGIKTIPFESCLIHNKCNRITSEIGQKLRVRTEPKWLTDLSMWQKDEYGVLGLTGVYSSNDFKASNHRKIKALNRFCDKYQPLFEQRKCTLLFLTFTNANKCKPWVTMIKIIREYFKRWNRCRLPNEISRAQAWKIDLYFLKIFWTKRALFNPRKFSILTKKKV